LFQQKPSPQAITNSYNWCMLYDTETRPVLQP